MPKKSNPTTISNKMDSDECEQPSMNQLSRDDDIFPLDDGMPKDTENSELQDSKVIVSKSSGKRSFRNLSMDIVLPDLPLNDDESELIDQEKALSELTNAPSTSTPTTEIPSTHSPVVSTLEMQEHVSRCVQLNTENKINTKNAFGLQLIDYMPPILAKQSGTNFTAAACQLDAGAKIYAYRVDAVHKDVMKLVETCMFAERDPNSKKSKIDDEDDSTEEGIPGTSSNAEKQKKKKTKKKVIATADQITRKPKEKDPREMFVKMEAIPGNILNKAKHDSKDLSLTLDRHVPFWNNMQQYTPTKATGTCSIPDITVNKNRTLGSALEVDYDRMSSSTSQSHCDNEDWNTEPDEPVDFDNKSEEEGLKETLNHTEEDARMRDVEVMFRAKCKMEEEKVSPPSQLDVMKALFHKSEDSEYDYLINDNSHYWAGPMYWKRAPGLKPAANKKKGLRKKKEPSEINYENSPAQSVLGKAPRRKRNMLTKSTMSKWSNSKVTLPIDDHLKPRVIQTLFNMDISPQILPNAPKEDEENDLNGQENDHSLPADEQDEGAINDDGNEIEAQIDFNIMRLENIKVEEEEECLSTLAGPSSSARPSHSSPSKNSSGAFEGDNLVPMVKTVKFDPIKYVVRPNRVDMQHLKSVMLNIILEAMEDQVQSDLLTHTGLMKKHPEVACLDNINTNIASDLIDLSENTPPSKEGTSSQGVMLKDVYSKLCNTDALHYRTREDLSFAMAFQCLLILTNENEFSLVNSEDGDVVISRSSVEASSSQED
ncbi:condensin complex subunit 2-like isoform X2 [Homalodisca vitripennis]|uniref:condensin complex subunit 2-like isoform X2 n=1 Tax=Homalodisca vitripennis TaxID=197043 RepID=UPI001EEBB529|nr:condensin complex subunit 2-like isoform X2 [Homalodisca vitripennis]